MPDDEVGALRAEVWELRRQISRLSHVVLKADAEEARREAQPKVTMHELENWVVEFMQNTLERRASNSRRWCAEWYKHPEVVTRFRALYLARLEIQRNDDAVMISSWWVDHVDKHLDAIVSSDGPFAACSPERHTPHRGLVIERNEDADQDWGPRPPRSNPDAGTRPRPVEANYG